MYPWAFRYESSIWRPWERMAHGTALIRKQTSERVVKVNSRWIKDLTENPTLKEAQENTWKLTGKPLRTIEYKARKKRTNASDYIKMKSLLQITRIKTKTEMICLALRSGASWEGAAREKRWPWNSVFSFWQNSTPCRKSLFLSVHQRQCPTYQELTQVSAIDSCPASMG